MLTICTKILSKNYYYQTEIKNKIGKNSTDQPQYFIVLRTDAPDNVRIISHGNPVSSDDPSKSKDILIGPIFGDCSLKFLFNDTPIFRSECSHPENTQKYLQPPDSHHSQILDQESFSIVTTAITNGEASTHINSLMDQIASNFSDNEVNIDQLHVILKLIEKSAPVLKTEIESLLPVETRKQNGIDRLILKKDSKLNYTLVAFIVSGNGSIHNHKNGVIGGGVSLNDSTVVEYQFKQQYPLTDPQNRDYLKVSKTDIIPQSMLTTLIEDGSDGLIHQLALTESAGKEKIPNIRLHVYYGGDVGVTGNPNNITNFEE